MGNDVGWANLWSCASVVGSKKVQDDDAKHGEEQWEVILESCKMDVVVDSLSGDIKNGNFLGSNHAPPTRATSHMAVTLSCIHNHSQEKQTLSTVNNGKE